MQGLRFFVREEKNITFKEKLFFSAKILLFHHFSRIVFVAYTLGGKHIWCGVVKKGKMIMLPTFPGFLGIEIWPMSLSTVL